MILEGRGGLIGPREYPLSATRLVLSKTSSRASPDSVCSLASNGTRRGQR